MQLYLETIKIFYNFSVDLPKKHGRGGQSALRFARLRLVVTYFLVKSNEIVKKYFTKDNKPTIKGLFLAGSADLKIKLSEADSFPAVLQPLIINHFDISYGGINGLNQAIELASSSLKDVKIIKEQKIISKYFNNINKDTGKICYGIKNTMYAIEMGAVNDIIIWEDLPLIRFIR